MKASAKLETVIDLVQKMSVNHFDETVPVKALQFEGLNQVWVDNVSVEVSQTAARLFSNRLKVPYSYLIRCPDSLVADNLNHWIAEEAKTRETFFCRFDGARLRAVFTERYCALDHLTVLNRMLESGFRLDQEVQYCLNENILVVKVPEYDRSFTISVRDQIVPGISIANSEVGALALSIEAYMYRMVCSNGLIVKTAVGISRFKHVSTRAVENFPETLSQVVGQSQRHQEKLLISTKTPVVNPFGTIESLSRQYGLGKTESEAVKAAWELEPGETMFAIINSFTRAAQAETLSVEQSYALEKVGGAVLSMIKH